MPMAMSWHSADPCYCSDPLLGEGDTALNFPSGKGEKYSSVARGSIHTKREYTYQGEWDHQHVFYKLDSIFSIFLTKPPNQNIFLCSNWIFSSLMEQYLPIFILERKKKNPWKNLFHPKQPLSFHPCHIFPVGCQNKNSIICTIYVLGQLQQQKY